MSGMRRVPVSSGKEEGFSGGRRVTVAIGLAAAAAAFSSGAGTATNTPESLQRAPGPQLLREVASAQKAPLHVLRSALSAATVGLATNARVSRPAKRDLSSNGAVRRYLRSLGVDPTGVVIQRGRLNYAGPNCPGQAWTCTRARRVVQITASARRVGSERSLASPAAPAPRVNRAECDPGTLSDPGDPFPEPRFNCSIHQIASDTDNVATCVLDFFAPEATQGCQILQENVVGRNRATAILKAHQSGIPAEQQVQGFDQIAIQSTVVWQFNELGENDARIAQVIDQRIHSGHGAKSKELIVGAGQAIDLRQQGAGRNDADIQQTYDQSIHNLARDVTLDLELGIQGATVFQCGAHSGLCVDGPARQSLQMRQTFSQDLNAPQAVSGRQGQAAQPFEDGCPVEEQTGAPETCGSVTQLSSGVSRAAVHQKGFQRASAPKTSQVGQFQDDPFRCCAEQLTNPNNRFQIDQDRTQLANSAIYEQLADAMIGTCDTSGICAVNQRANQNGEITLNSCSGSFCDIRIVCEPGGGACTATGPTTNSLLARRRG